MYHKNAFKFHFVNNACQYSDHQRIKKLKYSLCSNLVKSFVNDPLISVNYLLVIIFFPPTFLSWSCSGKKILAFDK